MGALWYANPMSAIGLAKPASKPLSPLPVVGAAAPSGPPLEALGGSPGIIAFLRHPGCPCAERTVRALGHLSTPTAVITHGDPQEARAWLTAIGAPGSLHIIFDEDRTEYARWGLGLTDARHFLALAPLLSVLRGWTEGARNRSATGTRYQQSGTFAVDASGIVRWRHLPAHGGEVPDLAAGLSALIAR